MPPVVLLVGTFFLLILLRVPLAFALGIASLLTILDLGLSPLTVANQMFSSINSFPLLAVPFFLFLGRLMNDGGITDRLLRVADATVGHIRGGLGHINVVVSMMFASISGSAAADTASVGAIVIPAMKKAGYNPAFSVAITAASSTLGMIIPPSILMVLYGAFGNVSIGALFLGGIVPGLMIGLGQMAYTYYVAVRTGHQPKQRKSAGEMGRAVFLALPPLSLPIIILGGIMSGVFTATEAAAVAVVIGLVLALVVYRNISPRDLPEMLGQAVVTYSVPLFCVATAGIMGWLIAYLNIATDISNFILSITDSPFGVYLMIIGFLIVIGTVLSPVTVVIIFLPILQHLGNLLGFDPVHLGLIVVLSMTMGLVTPPYGICLLIATQIGEVPVPRAFLAVLPLLAIAGSVILLGVIFPELFLYLPKTFLPDAFAS
ncbi:MAG: TRAP transporter large permease [Rhodospirillales bacterium]|nr:TRAP transporter large permease [Rhodospirillales bacterium]